MTFNDTYNAIAAITAIIHEKLSPPLNIQVGAPRQNQSKKLYLLLYETEFDSHLKNYSYDADPKFKHSSIREKEPPLVWLILKYLLIAYDDDKPTDTNYKAYGDMGLAISKLNDIHFLDVPKKNWIKNALSPCLDRLKITFDPAPYELLSKILGDVTSKYQFCISFQVRPVMIASIEEPSTPYRVGIDSQGSVRDDGGIFISSSLEESLDLKFENDDIDIEIKEIKVFEDQDDQSVQESKYNLNDIEATLGNVKLAIKRNSEFKLLCTAKLYVNDACQFTANAHIMKITHKKKPIYSRTINLKPYITNVSKRGKNLIISGTLLGRPEDRVMVEFYYKKGKFKKCILIVADFKPNDFDDSQIELKINEAHIKDLIPGRYQIIARINNQKSNEYEKTIT